MIISASRRTDIPAFYSEWFMKRIEEGHVMVRNPMNARQVSRISLEPELVDCIVFWTKDPSGIIGKLDVLDRKKYSYYFQFTLTPYGKDIELSVPEKEKVVSRFIDLSERIGKERVVWRYDPILLTDSINRDYHFRSFERLAKALAEHTDKCIISFADFYKKCSKRLSGVKARETTREDMLAIAETFAGICKAQGLKLETCAEEIDLSCWGIEHGKCIDDALISRITGRPLAVGKDKSQREHCGCVASVDIGAYNSCPHGCLYCYANSGNVARSDDLRHNPDSPFLIDHLVNS